jgi:hypothetical protein
MWLFYQSLWWGHQSHSHRGTRTLCHDDASMSVGAHSMAEPKLLTPTTCMTGEMSGLLDNGSKDRARSWAVGQTHRPGAVNMS